MSTMQTPINNNKNITTPSATRDTNKSATAAPAASSIAQGDAVESQAPKAFRSFTGQRRTRRRHGGFKERANQRDGAPKESAKVAPSVFLRHERLGSKVDDSTKGMSPECIQWVQALTPVLSVYDFDCKDIADLVRRCEFDLDKIQDSVANICEEKKGHEQNDWQISCGRKPPSRKLNPIDPLPNEPQSRRPWKNTLDTSHRNSRPHNMRSTPSSSSPPTAKPAVSAATNISGNTIPTSRVAPIDSTAPDQSRAAPDEQADKKFEARKESLKNDGRPPGDFEVIEVATAASWVKVVAGAKESVSAGLKETAVSSEGTDAVNLVPPSPLVEPVSNLQNKPQVECKAELLEAAMSEILDMKPPSMTMAPAYGEAPRNRSKKSGIQQPPLLTTAVVNMPIEPAASTTVITPPAVYRTNLETSSVVLMPRTVPISHSADVVLPDGAANNNLDMAKLFFGSLSSQDARPLEQHSQYVPQQQMPQQEQQLPQPLLQHSHQQVAQQQQRVQLHFGVPTDSSSLFVQPVSSAGHQPPQPLLPVRVEPSAPPGLQSVPAYHNFPQGVTGDTNRGVRAADLHRLDDGRRGQDIRLSEGHMHQNVQKLEDEEPEPVAAGGRKLNMAAQNSATAVPAVYGKRKNPHVSRGPSFNPYQHQYGALNRQAAYEPQGDYYNRSSYYAPPAYSNNSVPFSGRYAEATLKPQHQYNSSGYSSFEVLYGNDSYSPNPRRRPPTHEGAAHSNLNAQSEYTAEHESQGQPNMEQYDCYVDYRGHPIYSAAPSSVPFIPNSRMGAEVSGNASSNRRKSNPTNQPALLQSRQSHVLPFYHRDRTTGYEPQQPQQQQMPCTSDYERLIPSRSLNMRDRPTIDQSLQYRGNSSALPAGAREYTCSGNQPQNFFYDNSSAWGVSDYTNMLIHQQSAQQQQQQPSGYVGRQSTDNVYGQATAIYAGPYGATGTPHLP